MFTAALWDVDPLYQAAKTQHSVIYQTGLILSLQWINHPSCTSLSWQNTITGVNGRLHPVCFRLTKLGLKSTTWRCQAESVCLIQSKVWYTGSSQRCNSNERVNLTPSDKKLGITGTVRYIDSQTGNKTRERRRHIRHMKVINKWLQLQQENRRTHWEKVKLPETRGEVRAIRKRKWQ